MHQLHAQTRTEIEALAIVLEPAVVNGVDVASMQFMSCHPATVG